jgi:hypothetical protein
MDCLAHCENFLLITHGSFTNLLHSPAMVMHETNVHGTYQLAENKHP